MGVVVADRIQWGEMRCSGHFRKYCIRKGRRQRPPGRKVAIKKDMDLLGRVTEEGFILPADW
jgi:hypothetical protein